MHFGVTPRTVVCSPGVVGSSSKLRLYEKGLVGGAVNEIEQPIGAGTMTTICCVACRSESFSVTVVRSVFGPELKGVPGKTAVAPLSCATGPGEKSAAPFALTSSFAS